LSFAEPLSLVPLPVFQDTEQDDFCQPSAGQKALKRHFLNQSVLGNGKSLAGSYFPTRLSDVGASRFAPL
jgi:hypothetical protein